MDQKTYLAERVDDQINWYNKKSKFNQNRFKSLRICTIVVSVTIPFLAGLISDERAWLKIAVGIGGVLIALIEGVQSLYKYQDLWLQYRLSSEMLLKEKILFLTQSGPYENDQIDTFKLFVKRAEAIMNTENKSWLEGQKKEDQQGTS